MKGCKQCELFEYQQQQYQEQLKHFTTSAATTNDRECCSNQIEHKYIAQNRIDNLQFKKGVLPTKNNLINCKHEKYVDLKNEKTSISAKNKSNTKLTAPPTSKHTLNPLQTSQLTFQPYSKINHLNSSSIDGFTAGETIPRLIQPNEIDLMTSSIEQEFGNPSKIIYKNNHIDSNCINANAIQVNTNITPQYQQSQQSIVNNISNQQQQLHHHNHQLKRSSSVSSSSSNCDTLSSLSALSPTKMPSPILPSPASLLVDSGRGSVTSITSSLNGNENMSIPTLSSSSLSSSSIALPISLTQLSSSSSSSSSSLLSSVSPKNFTDSVVVTKSLLPTATQILPPNGPALLTSTIPNSQSLNTALGTNNVSAHAAAAAVADRTIAAANFAQSFALLQPHFRNMFYAAQLFSGGYYQPAGPLIHSHVIAAPPPSHLSGSSSQAIPVGAIKQLSTQLDISDSDTQLQQPPPSTSAAESTDSDVLITGGDLATFRYPSSLGGPTQNQSSQSQNNNNSSNNSVAQQQLSVLATAQQQQQQAAAAAAAAAYTRSMHQMHYPSAYPPGYYSPYHPGEVCYTAPYQPYFPSTKSYSPAAAAAAAHHQYRRYQPTGSYYQPGPPPGPPSNDLYGDPTQSAGSSQPQNSAQVVQSQQQQPPPNSSQLVPAGQALQPLPPSAQHMDHYPGPPSFYTGYSPGGAGGGSSGGGNNNQCFSRGMQPSYIEYPPACPCPMQSCPKNVLTGPLIGSNNNLVVNNNSTNNNSTSNSNIMNNHLTNSSTTALNTTMDMKLLNINNTMNSSPAAINNNIINNSLNNNNIVNHSNQSNQNNYHHNHHTSNNSTQMNKCKSNKGPVKNQHITQNNNSSINIAANAPANQQHSQHNHHMHTCKVEITEPPTTIEMKTEITDDLILTGNRTASCIPIGGGGIEETAISVSSSSSSSSPSITSHNVSNKNKNCNALNKIMKNNESIGIININSSDNDCRDSHNYETNCKLNINNRTNNSSSKTLTPPIKTYTVNDKLLELEREMTISPARGSTGLPTIPDSTEKAAIITPAAANFDVTPTALTVDEQRIEPALTGSQNCNMIGRKARIGKTMAREMMYGQAATAVVPNSQHSHLNAQVFNQHNANLFLNHPSQFATPAESIIQSNSTDRTIQLSNHQMSGCHLTTNTFNASTLRFPSNLNHSIKTENIKTEEEDDVVLILDDEKQTIKIEEPDVFEVFDDKIEALSDDSMFKEDIKPNTNILTPSSGLLSTIRRMKILETNCNKSTKKSPKNGYKSLIKQTEPKPYLCLSRRSDKKDRFKFLKQTSKTGLKRRKLVLTEDQKQRLKDRKKVRLLERRKLKEQQIEAKTSELLNKEKKTLIAQDETTDIQTETKDSSNIALIPSETSEEEKIIEPAENQTMATEEIISETNADFEEIVNARLQKLKTPLDLTIELVSKGYFSEPELRSPSVLSKHSTTTTTETSTTCRKHKKSKKTEARSKSETNETKKCLTENTILSKEPNNNQQENEENEIENSSLFSKLSSTTSLNKQNQKNSSKTIKLKSKKKLSESSINSPISQSLDSINDIPLSSINNKNDELSELSKKSLDKSKTTKKQKHLSSKKQIEENEKNCTNQNELMNSPSLIYADDICSNDTNLYLTNSETITNNNNILETNNNKILNTQTDIEISIPLESTIDIPTNHNCSDSSVQDKLLQNSTNNDSEECISTISVECTTNDDKNESAASNTNSSDNYINNNNNLTHPKNVSTVVQNNSDEYFFDHLQYNSQFHHHHQHHQGQKRKASRSRFGNRKRQRRHAHELVETAIIPRKANAVPKWNNGWSWEGEPFQGKVFLNSDDPLVIRTCYPAMRHSEGDSIRARDCVLLRAGTKKNELPYVAKVAHLWENPEDGEMMMSLLWYYRPEHTEQGRQPADCADEVFASRHRDHNSVACIEDKCYVLTFSEYCRHRRTVRAIEENIEEPLSIVPPLPNYVNPREVPLSTNPEQVMFCQRVYDFRLKRLMKTN